MCLAIPARIIRRDEQFALVDMGGIQKLVSTLLVPDAKQDDFILVHAGFGIQIMDHNEAALTMALLKELAQHGGGIGYGTADNGRFLDQTD